MPSRIIQKLLDLIFKPLSKWGIHQSIQSTALWSMLESFSNPFFTLLLIPVLTHYLGLENYGVYVMLMAFVSLLSFTGLGMNTSITYYLSVNHHTLFNDKEIAQRLGTAITLAMIGTTSASIVIVIIYNSYHVQISEYMPIFKNNYELIYLTLVLMVLTQVDLVVSAAIKGLQQFRASSKLELLIRTLGFFALCVITLIFKSVTAIIFCSIVVVSLAVAMRFLRLKLLANFSLNEITINKEFAKELFYFGKWMTLQNIAVALFGSLDKIILGTLLGSKVVGIYNVVMSITQLVHFIPANILTFVMPKVAKNAKAMSLYSFKKMTIITATLACSIALMLLLIKSYLFDNLVIGTNYSSLYYGLIFSYVLLSLNVPSYFVALGMRLIHIVAIQCVAGAIFGIITLFVFVAELGVMAAVASKLMYAIVALLLFLPVLKNIKSRV